MIVLNEREEFIVSQFKENMFNIDASILQTTFFTKSWVKYTDLDKDNFYKKLKELKELDILKDKNSKDIEVTHILFIDYRKDNKIYAIDINLFSTVLSTEKKVIQHIFNIGDFFIPRSLWWKLFKELYSSKS